jgi:putative glutamine amidotransferase
VGVPLCLDDRGRWRPGRRYHYVDAAYAESLTRAGALAVYLPGRDDVEPLLDSVDGLLVPGGDDLPPPGPLAAGVELDLVPEEQLAFDRALVSGALERGLPLFGICYGMQLLALACGGELHYHLPSDLPEVSPHKLHGPEGRHPLRVAPGSRLAALIGCDPGPVNSLHHQGVASTGRLEASAWADDGVVEALEGAGDAFCVGVQWHPEKLRGNSSQRLFSGFVAACASLR